MMDAKELAGRFPAGASAAGLGRGVVEFELCHCLCPKHFARALTLEPAPAVCGFLITAHSAKSSCFEWELDEFLRKTQWNTCSEAHGTEQTAPFRALLRCFGSLPGDIEGGSAAPDGGWARDAR
jgi:hypothetical protein